MPTCSLCGSRVSIFRLRVHQRSNSCWLSKSVRNALAGLRAVGGYVAYGALPVLRLSSGGKLDRARKQLAVGVDDLGHATVVDMHGRVRQYLHGEWAYSGDTERHMIRSEGGV